MGDLPPKSGSELLTTGIKGGSKGLPSSEAGAGCQQHERLTEKDERRSWWSGGEVGDVPLSRLSFRRREMGENVNETRKEVLGREEVTFGAVIP